jgi:paraquat-inducible protein B
VELDILRNASPVKAEQLMPYKGSPQIPTQLSSLDAALATLDDIPVQEILLDVVASMKRMNEQFQKLDISGLVASLKLTSDAIRTQVEMLGTAAGKTVDTYSDLALSAQKDLDVALKHIHETLDSVESMAGRTSAAMNEAREAMASVQETSKSAGALFAEDSVPVLEFSQTMLALGKAAQALSDLATLLEIKPNSLIFGRNR